MSAFRLRCKVMERDGRRYLVALGMALPPACVYIDAYCMSDDETVSVRLTLDEWNALPFHWFEDAGDAPPRVDKWRPGVYVGPGKT